MRYFLRCCGFVLDLEGEPRVCCRHDEPDLIPVADDFRAARPPTPVKVAECPHLGRRTGKTIEVRGCKHGGARVVQIHQCKAHGEDTVRTRTFKWKGRDCQTCRYKGEDG